MKSIIQKVLMLVGLVSVIPFFSYAAFVTCTPDYTNGLAGQSISFTAKVIGGNGTAYDFSWDGDDGIEVGNVSEFSHTFSGGITDAVQTVNITASSTDSEDYLTGSCSVHIYDDASAPAFSASCSPSTDIAVIGQEVSWYTNISGPFAPYTVTSWSGTDGETMTYTTSGTKSATMLTFASRYGSQTETHNASVTATPCSASINVVGEEIHNPTDLVVTGSCSAVDTSVYVNDTVTWSSNLNISGGAAPYQITWSDNEGVMATGSSTSKTYSTIGTKSARLSVEDNAGQSIDVDCSNTVDVRNRRTGGNHSSSGSGSTNNETGTSTATSTNSGTGTTGTSTATSTNNVTGTSTDSGTGSTGNDTSSTGNDSGNNNQNGTGTSTDNTSGDIVETGYQFNNNQNSGSDNSGSGDQNQGLTSEEVANLQNRLSQEGFYNGPVDGNFSSDVQDALRQYQSANGLPVTGILDPVTRQFMNENVGEMINDYYVNPNYIFNNNLRIGDRSQDVANLQNRLKEEGFYTGLIGGYFGELTQSALMAYQKSVGLPATGVMDQVVRARLNIETKQALADSIKKLVEENSANGFLAAAAGLLKTNTKNIIIVIFGLIALGLLSWGVMVGLKKLKNTV